MIRLRTIIIFCGNVWSTGTTEMTERESGVDLSLDAKCGLTSSADSP